MMSISMGALQAGDLLNARYRLDRVLGVGGMGVVWAARREPDGGPVAVKILSPERAQDGRLVHRFLCEASSAAKLRGEHAVHVYDFGALDDGTPFMAMELLDGLSLSAYLRARRALPPGEAVEWVLQACRALFEAHAEGIIHRDLKPANLFLANRRDGSRIIKVLDFGIAKRLDGVVNGITAQGMLLGSPCYMAPEQIAAPSRVDPRADVWALGVTLFELLSGQKPFIGPSLSETLAQVLHADPPDLLALCPHLSPGLAGVVYGCLEKARERRVSSVASLAQALAPFRTRGHASGTFARPGSVDRTLSLYRPAPPPDLHADDTAPEFDVSLSLAGGDDPVPSSSSRETLVAPLPRALGPADVEPPLALPSERTLPISVDVVPARPSAPPPSHCRLAPPSCPVIPVGPRPPGLSLLPRTPGPKPRPAGRGRRRWPIAALVAISLGSGLLVTLLRSCAKAEVVSAVLGPAEGGPPRPRQPK